MAHHPDFGNWRQDGYGQDSDDDSDGGGSASSASGSASHSVGFPGAAGTGLVRSMFRPSDDATKLPFLVPANAMAATELRRARDTFKEQSSFEELGRVLDSAATSSASRCSVGRVNES